jgi:hypothetical protein
MPKKDSRQPFMIAWLPCGEPEECGAPPKINLTAISDVASVFADNFPQLCNVNVAGGFKAKITSVVFKRATIAASQSLLFLGARGVWLFYFAGRNKS